VSRGGGRRPRRGGARAGSAIHDGLVGERALIGTPYLADPALRNEYARDIAPRTRAALGKILAEVFPPDAAAPGRAIDLGAGTGAVGEALRARFGADLDVVGVDRVAAPGVVTTDLASALPQYANDLQARAPEVQTTGNATPVRRGGENLGKVAHRHRISPPRNPARVLRAWPGFFCVCKVQAASRRT